MLDEGKWRAKDFNLTTLLIDVFKCRKVRVFISISVTIDRKNVSRRLIKFDQGGLGLGDSTHANVAVNREKIASDVDEIIELETRLARIQEDKAHRTDFSKTYNLKRLSDMQTLMPLVDWDKYFYAITPPSIHKYLAADPEILITEIDYMRRVTDLLNSTDPRIITNYVYIRYSSTWNGELGERYERAAQQFHHLMYGRKEKAPRWKDCATTTMLRMQYVSGALYVKNAFSEETKNATLEMINDLQEAFHDILIENDWIDDVTKAKALDKARHMLRHIGYPDFILDDRKLDEYYKGLSIEESDSYSEMVGKLTRWSIEFNFKRLLKPVDRAEFNINPAIVNAMPKIFRALNYGGIGTIIGHEITHGFDDKGRQFDAVGNLRDWWSSEMKKQFEKRAQCFIDQYSRIEVSLN
ncbi:unnamed protein product [Angiostrongylus costaricensis]|uniref:Peptidase_M13 domain-containing protein n=1 Tax=Angiostrongylus costaricensis TaxID=334426 RepID=A0A158PLW7_ANGCS|nr:unnamed protein product [Angiostrongylus costaricensis]